MLACPQGPRYLRNMKTETIKVTLTKTIMTRGLCMKPSVLYTAVTECGTELLYNCNFPIASVKTECRRLAQGAYGKPAMFPNTKLVFEVK